MKFIDLKKIKSIVPKNLSPKKLTSLASTTIDKTKGSINKIYKEYNELKKREKIKQAKKEKLLEKKKDNRRKKRNSKN